jgi:hypothetical protein
MLLILTVALLVIIDLSFISGSPISGKIVGGIDKLSDSQVMSSSSGNIDVNEHLLLPPVPSANFYGPESLLSLSQNCFLENFDRYEYQICPFHNITQKRVMGSHVTLLGVWGFWNAAKVNITLPTADVSTENENEDHISQVEERMIYNSMEYVEGVACDTAKGGPQTSTTLHLTCGPTYKKFEILEVQNDKYCEYSIKLAVPFPCALLIEGYDQIIQK